MRLLNGTWCAALLASLVLTTGASAEPDYVAAQGWSKSDLKTWYEASQGSRLIQRKWFEALQDDAGRPLASREVLEGLGYIYLSDAPDSLPAGWVYDESDEGAALGLNCSACHTSKLSHGDKSLIVHGGQAMADFQGFLNLLMRSVERVLGSDAAFKTFSNDVLGKAASQPARLRLRADVTEWWDFRKQINDTSQASHWGRGRADAVGVILATTAAVIARSDVPPEERPPLPESNAPVSYPFVWNANQQGVLQHNGVVDNGVDLGLVEVAKIGALIRNWTEALGVFADVKLSDNGETVTSSINFKNLLQLEQVLAKLQSPRWPAAFGSLDAAGVARGDKLFQANCASCHGKLASDDLTSDLPLVSAPVDVSKAGHQGMVYLQQLFDSKTTSQDFDKTLNPDPVRFIGTDPAMACNALMHTVPTGKLEGTPNVEGFLPGISDRNFAERAVTTDLLRALIQRDVFANKRRGFVTFAENQALAAFTMFQKYAYAEYDDDPTGQGADNDRLTYLRGFLQRCENHLSFARTYRADVPLPSYKARPLNGIWATAPYLHNGSIPTLYDLLLPQNQRPASFGYFAGEMDVAKGGLSDASDKPGAFQFKVYDTDGFATLGNWNGGHEYGLSLTHEHRLDLVEYLKSL